MLAGRCSSFLRDFVELLYSFRQLFSPAPYLDALFLGMLTSAFLVCLFVAIRALEQ